MICLATLMNHQSLTFITFFFFLVREGVTWGRGQWNISIRKNKWINAWRQKKDFFSYFNSLINRCDFEAAI